MLKPKLAYYHAVGDHFNVSRITISRLIIRFRKTGRTNDRPRNGRPRVTSHCVIDQSMISMCDLLKILGGVDKHNPPHSS